jgi:hypothetical protein
MEVNCVIFEVNHSIYAPKLPLSIAFDHNCVAIHGKELYKSAHGKHAVIASFSGMLFILSNPTMAQTPAAPPDQQFCRPI